MKTGQCQFTNNVCQCGKKRSPNSRTLVYLELADAMSGGYRIDDLTMEEARAIAAIQRMQGMKWQT